MLGLGRNNFRAPFGIGVDLGFDAVRLLQLCERPDGSLAVAAALRHSLWESQPSRDPLARLQAGLVTLEEAMRSGSFKGRTVIAALPRQDVHVRSLRIPLVASEGDASIIEREAAAAFPLALDTASLGYLHAGEVRHGGGEARREVIAIASAQEDVDDFLERLHAAGAARVSALDIQSLALHRAVTRCLSHAEDDATVVLDIGAQGSEVLIGRGGGISVIRTINIGGNHLNGAVARRMGISEEDARRLRERLEAAPSSDPSLPAQPRSNFTRDPREAVRRNVFDAIRSTASDLAAELTVCLRYYSVTFRGRPVTRMVLTGGEARYAQVSQTLTELLGIPVQPAPVFAGIESPPTSSESDAAEWAVAMGLALRGIPGDAGRFSLAENHSALTEVPRG